MSARTVVLVTTLVLASVAAAGDRPAASSCRVSGSLRTRLEAWDWFDPGNGG